MSSILQEMMRLTQRSELSLYQQSLPYFLLWRIWKARNELLFNRTTMNLHVLLELLSKDVQEWVDSVEYSSQATMISTDRQQSERSLKTWLRPPEDMYKCNYDTAINTVNQRIGIGWILRNHRGELIRCGMASDTLRTSIAENEFSGLLYAIQAVWSLGYKNVIFEGDNLHVNECIHGVKGNLRLLSYLETLQVWKQSFISLQHSHYPHTGNKCADVLAKKALYLSEPCSLMSLCPEFLFGIYQDDITLSS